MLRVQHGECNVGRPRGIVVFVSDEYRQTPRNTSTTRDRRHWHSTRVKPAWLRQRQRGSPSPWPSRAGVTIMHMATGHGRVVLPMSACRSSRNAPAGNAHRGHPVRDQPLGKSSRGSGTRSKPILRPKFRLGPKNRKGPVISLLRSGFFVVSDLYIGLGGVAWTDWFNH